MSTTTTHAASGAGEDLRAAAVRLLSYYGSTSPESEVAWDALERAVRATPVSSPTTDLAARFEAKREKIALHIRSAYRAGLDGDFAVLAADSILSHFAFGSAFGSAFAEARDMARAGAAGGAGDDIFGDFNEADYKPDLASAIAAEIMGLKWTHAVPDGVQFTDEAAQDEHCNRYGDVQEVVSAALTKARTQPHVTPPPAQQGSSSPPLTAERGDLLRGLLDEAVSFLEMDEEANKPGTDLYTFIATVNYARERLDLVPASLPAGTGSADEGTDLGAPNGGPND